ncbi:DUF3307 domain-containing protein [Candidatus Oscillochloris fontis]|uniref:DUF3307 domain-containing protein n=1 Tax=Candidatus Oscillochloris fontis TaxID=2496868 RepID=UPI00101CDE6E|nr:DUF3307 domain-containing protein [Candidatus Oscillochloris fontis]
MLYLFFLAHLVADFMLQPLWLIQRKRYWYGLVIHVGLVLVCMLAIIPFEPRAAALWPVMMGISVVHFGADHWKIQYGDRMVRSPLLAFLLDQVIHAVTIIIGLSLALPLEQVWSLQTSAFALPAIYAICYLLASFAAPITLIVALDPTFKHASLAAAARVRSLVAAVVVLSLAIFVTPVALPATLAGIAAATRHPASGHPLDSPLGLMVVVLVAASLGAVLTLVL